MNHCKTRILIILICINFNLFSQENFKNLGLSISNSASAADLATRIDLCGILNKNELQLGPIITRFSGEPKFKYGIKGLYFGYKFYPNNFKSFNWDLYLDNKLLSYNSVEIPSKPEYQYVVLKDQIAKVKLYETLIGFGFDIRFRKRFKFFSDLGLGYMWKWYKFEGYPESPSEIKDFSFQLRIGIACYLKRI